MSIKIITYSDPYKISQNDLCWKYFKSNLQFCASQTMVNGLMREYEVLGIQEGQLIPVDSLINSMFDNWNEIGHKISQYHEVNSVLKTICLSDTDYEHVKNSLDLNNQFYLDAIRLLFELDIKVEDIELTKNSFTLDQLYLVSAYEKLIGNKEFYIKPHFEADEIDGIFTSFLSENNLKLDDTIVFNGIHQFSPMILRAILNIAEYREVVLMFNYNDKYSKVYETWLNVYSQFDEKIEISNEDAESFEPINDSQMLGVQLAQMLEGTLSVSSRIPLSNAKVIVFDNTTEFARYVSDHYEEALRKKKALNDTSHNVLAFMDEQFYAAKSDVNKILRIYYPEQFGEQRFLNYPIGRFFVAIANMWNVEENDSSAGFRNISECLLSGIIRGDTDGRLNETFIQCKDYIGNADYLDLNGVISRLNSLKAALGYKLKKNPSYEKISYFNCKPSDLLELISGLSELRQISNEFFQDFSKNKDSFKVFYKKVSDFLKKRVETEENLDVEFRSILERLLERLNKSDYPDSNPTFSCLRQTMAYYLDQEEKPSARWIVRNFEQIEGDILRSKYSDKNVAYHFCCVSDANMSLTHFEQYPWPLTKEFFEGCSDVDSQVFRIYSESRKERANFKRYSLIYGLLFNKSNLVISYVKNENEKVNELYCLLKLLGIPEEDYARQLVALNSLKRVLMNYENVKQKTEYSNEDRLRYYICPNKFAYDSIINERTIYKDHFMIKKYIAVILAERVYKDLNGILDSDIIIDAAISRTFDSVKNDFSSIREAEWADILSDAKDMLTNYSSELKNGITSEFIDCVLSRINWTEANDNYLSDESVEIFNENVLGGTGYFTKRVTGVCKTCVDREICKACFRGE